MFDGGKGVPSAGLRKDCDDELWAEPGVMHRMHDRGFEVGLIWEYAAWVCDGCAVGYELDADVDEGTAKVEDKVLEKVS